MQRHEFEVREKEAEAKRVEFERQRQDAFREQQYKAQMKAEEIARTIQQNQ